MDEFEGVRERLVKARPKLTPTLRRAAAYLLDNPGDVATLSMRKVAQNAEVAPPNFARLAKELGFETYNELRDVYRRRVQAGDAVGYPERAKSLQSAAEDQGDEALWAGFRDAALANLAAAFAAVDAAAIAATATELRGRERVFLAGMQASYSFMRHLHYIAGMASPDWRLLGREGDVLGDDLADLGERDAVICLALPPCSKASMQIAELARERGALVVGLTNSLHSPLAALADRLLLAPSESPSFFDSYIAATAIIEMLVGFYVKDLGAAAVERIDRIEADRRRLGEYWNA